MCLVLLPSMLLLVALNISEWCILNCCKNSPSFFAYSMTQVKARSRVGVGNLFVFGSHKIMFAAGKWCLLCVVWLTHLFFANANYPWAISIWLGLNIFQRWQLHMCHAYTCSEGAMALGHNRCCDIPRLSERSNIYYTPSSSTWLSHGSRNGSFKVFIVL